MLAAGALASVLAVAVAVGLPGVGRAARWRAPLRVALALALPEQQQAPPSRVADGSAPDRIRSPGERLVSILDNLDQLRVTRGVSLGRQRALHVDGGVSLQGDYPALCGSLRLRTAARLVELPLPTVQVVPKMVAGAMVWELRVQLLSGEF